MGKGGRIKTTPHGGPLGRWGAFFTHRAQVLLHVEPLGPRVAASTPEQLVEKTIETLIDAVKDDPEN